MSTIGRSHARKNILTGEWVLVSPNRLQRPWQGQVESGRPAENLQHDNDCYLCPGNKRADNHKNPDYRGPFAFDNDFPALSSITDVEIVSGGLFQNRSDSGLCRVICYTEQHNKRLATMSVTAIEAALKVLCNEFTLFDQNQAINYVQIFENRGEMMGCSNQHPHAQIWATTTLPNEINKELREQVTWHTSHGSQLLVDYRDSEIKKESRIIFVTNHFIALVPYWGVWPYEAMLLPLRSFAAPDEMKPEEITDLAITLKTVLSAYDKMFDTSAPYSMGFHPRPSDGRLHPEWVFHVHIYPPLLRSATIRKHLVGFEMLAMPQRDITPEDAAAALRDYCL